MTAREIQLRTMPAEGIVLTVISILPL